MSNVFGNIITAKQVRKAVENNVRIWAPDYLAEIGERDGRHRDSLPTFRNYFTSIDMDNLVEGQLPSCIIVAPGTISGTIKKRSTAIDARWAVGIGCVVSAKDEHSTFELAELYSAAMMALMIQHPSMEGFSAGVTLLSVTNELLDANGKRTIAAGIIQLGVDVNAIVDQGYGPPQPSETPTDEPLDWPTVEVVDVTVTAGVDGI